MPPDAKSLQAAVSPAGESEPLDMQAGVDRVLEHLLAEAPRRVLIYKPNDLVPKRLTPRETRELLQGLRKQVDPVIVTSRMQGTDMIVRTLEYFGDGKNPSRPTSPVPPDSDSNSF